MVRHTRQQKIWRDISSKKMRTLLVSISIFVGVLAVVVLATLGQLLSRQLQEDLQPSQMAMLRVYLNSPSSEPIDNSAALETLRQLFGVTEVEGQAVYQFAWRQPHAGKVNEGQLFSYSESFGQIRLDPVRLFNGRFPIEDQHEIAIEQRMAERYKIAIDDIVEIRQPNGRFQEWTVTGIIFQPYIYIGSSPQTSAYMNYSDAQSTIGFTGYTSIFARFHDFPTATQQSTKFRDTLRQETPYKISFHLIENPEKSTILISVRRFATVLNVLAILAMIVSSFLITNNMVALVAEQRQQIGILKSLGATRIDILKMYLGVALAYGFLGTIPALIIGIPIGQEIAEYVAPNVNTIIRNDTPPLTVPLTGLALGLGIPVLAAYIPAYRASNLSILESLTNLGISRSYKNGLLQRLLRFLPLPLVVETALNNILKNRWRVALTSLTLTFAVMSFMSILTVIISLDSVLDETRSGLGSISKISSASPAQMEFFSIFTQLILIEEDKIREIQPGVAVELQVYPVPRVDEAGLPEDGEEPTETTVFVTGIDTSASSANIPLTDGVGWNDDPTQTGIVISNDLADKLDVSLGDFLHIRAPDSASDFEIIGVSNYGLEIAFMEWEQLSQFVGIIRDAPIPNAYWEQVQVYAPAVDDNDIVVQTVWIIGIDEQVGDYLSEAYDPKSIIISQTLAENTNALSDTHLTLNYVPPSEDLIDTLTEFSEDVAEEMGEERPSFLVSDVVEIDSQQLQLLAQYAPPELLEQENPLIIAMYWAELAELTNLDYRKISPKTYYIDLGSPEQLTSLENYVPVTAHSNQLSFADSIAQTIFSLAIVMNTAALFMGLIGGIGLLTTSSMNVRERQREIGVMRSVGAGSNDIILQFYSEGLLIGVLCWVAALPLSYYLGDVLLNLVPFKEIIHYRYTVIAPLAGLVGILIVTSLASIYPAVLASRKTISEILRY